MSQPKENPGIPVPDQDTRVAILNQNVQNKLTAMIKEAKRNASPFNKGVGFRRIIRAEGAARLTFR